MSLSKQLIALLSAMFLAIFAVNYVTSVNNIRSYLQNESEIHAQDTATSLGLSLSGFIIDPQDPMLETLINSIFDSGYYREILLEDPAGKELVRKTNPKTFAVIPAWFTNLLPMETAKASSEISSGWTIGGVIHVTIHPGIGYLKLWEQAKRAFYYSVAAFAVSLVLLFLVLRLVLRPLERIDRFAHAIADGKFGTLDPLPWTKEIRNVAVSMNMMSTKIQGVINNLNAKLEAMTTRLRVDELTGLETKSTFETAMKEQLMVKGAGYFFVLRIDELGEFARQKGNETADRFVKAFAECLARAGEGAQGIDVKSYRFMGAEFALIVSGLDKDNAENFCEALVKAFSVLGDEFDKPEIARFGGAPYGPMSTIPGLIAAANEAYEKARLIGPNGFALSEDSDKSKDMDAWRALVSSVIAEKRFEVITTARAERLAGDEAGQIVLEEAFTKIVDDQGESVPIGTFVSMAETSGEVSEFDLGVVDKVIAYIRAKDVKHDVAVNLAFDSLAKVEFRSRLHEVLQENREIARQLAFSVTAYTAAKDLAAFRSFIDFIRRHGAKVLLKRFETRFMPLDQIREYNLDYIRLARVYTENISGDEQKRRVVEALKELGDLVDIRIVAEQVTVDEDFEVVRAIGLYAASR